MSCLATPKHYYDFHTRSQLQINTYNTWRLPPSIAKTYLWTVLQDRKPERDRIHWTAQRFSPRLACYCEGETLLDRNELSGESSDSRGLLKYGTVFGNIKTLWWAGQLVILFWGNLNYGVD